tara:strand:- start:7589 stop:10204 length:2616 start_codon:yes stop_codon:yes gene_type:complete
MIFSNTSQNLTFIGSGISSSFTLLNILESIEKDDNEEKVAITLIDKYPEFFCGIPYGSRSGYSVLLITSLENFLPEPELEKFIEWLNQNKDWLLLEFQKEGGELSQKWLDNYSEEIEANKWGNLFIPRRFFGCYIEEKLNTLINILEKRKTLTLNLIKGEVIDIVKINQNYIVALEDGSHVFTEKVILAVGSLPTRKLWKQKDVIEEDNLLFVNLPYSPSLNSNLEYIKNYVQERKGKATNVLVIGSNASGLEMIYKLNDSPEINAGISSYKFISTQGLLPDSEVDYERQKHFVANHLEALAPSPVLTANEIAQATYQDLEVAHQEELGAASTVGIISSAFGNLLSKLDTHELKSFACHHGNEIGRRQRCAGTHYSKTIDHLKEIGKFDHIAGRFLGLKKEANDEFYLEYLDTATQKVDITTTPVHLVINCIGGMDLLNENIPVLIKNLIQKKYVVANESQIGFDVNENLEAHINLHIVGPLLAGNIIENKAVWHVEHCGRIVWLSKVLADKIQENWKDKLYTTNPKLRITPLHTQTSIENYNARIKTDWQSNPYYFYEYFAHHQKKDNELIVLELFDNGKPLALMPIIKRTIPNTDGTYFDAISPYGYSGPLFKENLSKQVFENYWALVDDWYTKNNIVSEFIRFGLNGNHAHYSSYLKPTLVNVFGCLFSNFELQWENFHSKVRNNYRKAINQNLKFEIFSGDQIGTPQIKAFYTIYIETMKRNNASIDLYFSIDYFVNLVQRNNSNFSLAFAYVDEVAISTELIISHNNFIYAFLGGTLADYYSYRPNDFLRVEIIKWGIQKGKRKYILGGGVSDNDGLYKSKKAFFPKDIDVTFYTGRKIINQNIYDELTQNKENNIRKDSFFPAYR